MSDLADLLTEADTNDPWENGAAGARGNRSWKLDPWWAWTLGALVLGLVTLVGAGASLADATLGTALRARSCDASSLPGLILVAIGSLLLSLGFTLSRLHHEGARVRWDPSTLAMALPVPATLLALTMPGVLGCAAASDVSDLAFVGDALVGQAGSILAAAAAALVGAALASSAHVAMPSAPRAATDAPAGIVELAMQEAEAIQAEGISTRFHGVDSDG